MDGAPHTLLLTPPPPLLPFSFELDHVINVRAIKIGHRRLQHAHILLPNASRRPLWECVDAENQPPHRPHLRSRIRLHHHYGLGQRQSALMARPDHCWLAGVFPGVFDCRVHRLRLHGSIRSPRAHGVGSMDYQRWDPGLRLVVVWQHAPPDERR